MVDLISYRIADALVRVLPARATDGLAVRIARAAFALPLPARGALEENLRRLLGRDVTSTRVRECARSAFEHFALALADFLRLERLGPETLDRSVEVRGSEHLEAALASGRGVIVLSAHVGSWEWGLAFLSARGARVHAIARPHRNRTVEEFFARRRGRWGVRRLTSRPLWVRAAWALRRHEWVALMGDRGAPGGGGEACDWAEVLARRTGALVLPAVMLRLPGGRHAACFEAPLPPQRGLRERWRAAVRPHLTLHPGQWCAFEPLGASLGFAAAGEAAAPCAGRA